MLNVADTSCQMDNDGFSCTSGSYIKKHSPFFFFFDYSVGLLLNLSVVLGMYLETVYSKYIIYTDNQCSSIMIFSNIFNSFPTLTVWLRLRITDTNWFNSQYITTGSLLLILRHASIITPFCGRCNYSSMTNSNGGLTKPLLSLGYGWLSISQYFFYESYYL